MRIKLKMLLCLVTLLMALTHGAIAEERMPMPSPALTVAETLEAGCDLTITLQPVDEARNYNLTLYRDEGSEQVQIWSGNASSSYNLTQTVAGHALEPGSYLLKVQAYPYDFQRYEPVTVERSIIITGERPEPPILTLYGDTVPMIRQAVYLSVDRDYVDCALSYSRDGREYDISHGVSGRNITCDSFSEPDDYAFRISLFMSGKWSAWSAPLEIHIGSMGTLKAPTFVSVPTQVATGSDFTVEITPVDGADYYRYSLGRSGYSISSRSFYGGRRVTLTDEDFSHIEPGTYTLTCTSCSEAPYEFSSATVEIEVVEGSPAPGPSVSLDASGYRVGDAAIVTVNAPGAKGLRLKLGSRSVSDDSASDCYRIPVKMEQEGEANVSASVKLNGAWTSYGEPTTLKVVSTGTLNPPVITLPESYRGLENEPLSFHVDADPRAEHTKVKIIRIVRMIGTIIGEATPVGHGDYTFPGTDLLACDYQIEATSSAYGMEAVSFTQGFTVSGTLEGMPPVANLKSPDVVDGEVAMFIVEAPGATQVKMRHDRFLDTASGYSSAYSYSYRSGILPIDPSSKIWRVENDRAVISCRAIQGYYRFSAFMDGQWGSWSAPIHVEGSASSSVIISDLPKPEIRLSAKAVKAGDPLMLTVAPTGYSAVGVLHTFAWNGMSYSWSIPANPTGPQLSGGANLDIDTSKLSVGVYNVILETFAEDGRRNTASAFFEVLEGSATPPKPTLSVSADRTEIFSGETVNFTLTASGPIQTFRVITPYEVGFSGSGSISSSMSSSGAYSGTPTNVLQLPQTYTGSCRVATAFRVCVDDVWSDACEPIVITVKGDAPTAPEVFPVLDFNLSAEAVASGSTVNATWGALEGAQSYRVEVYADKNGVSGTLRGTVTGTRYAIATTGLPAGRYTVSVQPVGEGYITLNDFCASRSFVVVTRADTRAVLKLPAHLTCIEEEAFERSSAQGVTLPENCTSIGSRAFANCAELVEIHIPVATQIIADDAFRNSNDVVIYCPSGSVAERYALSHGMTVVNE